MKRSLSVLAACLVTCVVAQSLSGEPAEVAPATAPATRPAGKIADRAACSSICKLKAPTDEALKTIAGLGYKWVDLSALTWAPHVSVKELRRDSERESKRVEAALKATGLRISNFTYDSWEAFGDRPFEEYEKDLEALAEFGAREKARLINIMGPSNKADRAGVAVKLKSLVAIVKKHGIILTVETHVGQITERPADALWLCKNVPGLGLTLDPSHYYAGPNQGKPFDELYPFVQGTGFRAGGMSPDTLQLAWGTGPIDFEKIVRGLEKAGYKGCYESEYLEQMNNVDAVESARKFLAWIRKL
jgi:sugar phosphate isomerase/epimerase